VPYWFAYGGGFLSEVIGRLIRMRRPPHLTRYAVSLIGRSTYFSIAKARQQLGWQPRVSIREGIRRSVEWYYNDYLSRDRKGAVASPAP
jgi:nucleoside-diphosphate-sugar epimerase